MIINDEGKLKFTKKGWSYEPNFMNTLPRTLLNMLGEEKLMNEIMSFREYVQKLFQTHFTKKVYSESEFKSLYNNIIRFARHEREVRFQLNGFYMNPHLVKLLNDNGIKIIK